MGYFVLDLEEPKTPETSAKTAIANLELFLESPDCDYLLSFAQHNIEEAIRLVKEKQNENTD